MRRVASLLIVTALVVPLCNGTAGAADRRDVGAYRGMGTWLDVY